jgi:Na+(H+)/acetate symporter ActP
VDVDVPSRVSVFVHGNVDGHDRTGSPVALAPGSHRVTAGTVLDFPSGSAVPQVKGIPADTNAEWARPLGGEGHGDPFYVTYSLIIATFLGTMGLPHVVVRFYTNPNGRQTRRTTVVVLALLSVFYLLPPAYAALGRIYTPELLLTGQTDAVVLVLPSRLVGGTLGELLGALVAGGAFAAFLSTSSGLTLSVAGVLSQDVLSLRGLRGFRVATFLAAAVPFGAALLVSGMSLADVVGLAFAVAASSFCPLLLLGIWWRRLTPFGAMAGMAAGGGLALVAGLVTLLVPPGSGIVYDLLSRPAAWTVPLGFAVMIVGSLLTPRSVPASVNRTMVRLHAPEALGLAEEETP